MGDIERAFFKVYLRADMEFGAVAASLVGAVGDGPLGVSLTPTPAWLEDALERVYAAGYTQAWENASAVVLAALRRAGGSLWRTTVLSAETDATAALVSHEVSIGLDVPEEAIAEYQGRRIPPLVRVYGTQRKKIAAKMVADVAAEGGTLRDMQSKLRTQFPAFSSFRSRNVARTESSHLYNRGALDRYRSSGAVVGMRFLAIVDDRTTEICVWHDGQEYRLEDAGLPVPPLHFMCRSTTVPILFNERPDWQTEPAPEGSQPLKGFGHHRSVVPNVTPEQMFAAVREKAPAGAAELLRKAAELT